jgi:hypothetical protein
MSLWKIFYTDGSSLKSEDLGTPGDVALIPNVKRYGAHSIIQPMGLQGVSRETIENYHFLYFNSAEKWSGVGFDGLIDHLLHNFNDIGCVINGRQSVSDEFFSLRKTIAQDADIIGAVVRP